MNAFLSYYKKTLHYFLFTILLTFTFNVFAAYSIIKLDESKFNLYSGNTTLESFETAATITGDDTVQSLPLSELGNHFEITTNRLFQLWGVNNYSSDGDQILFMPTLGVTDTNNRAEITFSNFDGTNAAINTFAFDVIDWANAGGTGSLIFSTNTGETGTIDVVDGLLPDLPDWEKRFYGIITSKPFDTITISTDTPGDWILFDKIRYGNSGLLIPNASQPLEDNISTSNICENTTVGFEYDVDGVNNGIASDPNETLVVMKVLNGVVTGNRSGNDKQLFFSYSNSACSNNICTNNCPSGKFVFQFVDMTVPNFNTNDSSTWVYKKISGISFTAWNDGIPRPGASASPYSQTKAYKEVNNAVASNLIDNNPSIDITGNRSASTDVFFEDLGDGIGEILVRTDFAENLLNDIVIYSKPANTRLGSNVQVQINNSTVTFDDVSGVGITDINTSSTGPDTADNFSVCEPPLYYNINTTAEYTGNINVCLQYDEACEAAGVSLMHYINGVWVDVTTSVDTNNNVVCGTVNNLSPFTIASTDGVPIYWYFIVIIFVILIFLFARKK